MKRIFITGTGTGVGKTFVTCAVAHQLRKNHKVAVAKPIITGWADANTDTHLLLAANGQAFDDSSISSCSPWRFAAPLSPDMAAAWERREVDFDEVKKFCQSVGDDDADYVLIEGAGGVMTPVNASKTFRDLMLELQVPVVLVAGSYLGAISHCLTAVESLRGVTEVTVVVNESAGSEVSLAETGESMRRFIKRPIMIVRRCESFKEVLDLTMLFN